MMVPFRVQQMLEISAQFFIQLFQWINLSLQNPQTAMLYIQSINRIKNCLDKESTLILDTYFELNEDNLK